MVCGRPDLRYDAGLQWFETERIEAVGFGWVVLRRGGSPHRLAIEPLLHPVDQPLGPEIAGWLDRIEWLRGPDDKALLGTVLRAAPGVRLDTSARIGGAGWEPTALVLRLDEGFRWTLPTDDPTAALVAGCDGTHRLADLVDVLAIATGVSADTLASPYALRRVRCRPRDPAAMTGQLSLFGSTAREPVLADLDGLLAGNETAVRRDATARLSIVVEQPWRVDALVLELAEQLGIDAETAAAEVGITVRTPWLAELLPLADAWARGAVGAPAAGCSIVPDCGGGASPRGWSGRTCIRCSLARVMSSRGSRSGPLSPPPVSPASSSSPRR